MTNGNNMHEQLSADIESELNLDQDIDDSEVVQVADLMNDWAAAAEGVFRPSSTRVSDAVSGLPQKKTALVKSAAILAVASVILCVIILNIEDSSEILIETSPDRKGSSPTEWLFQLDDNSFRVRDPGTKKKLVKLNMTHLSAKRGVTVVFINSEK